MTIDFRTLLIVHVLVSVALALLMAVFWRGHRGTPGLAQWTLGACLIGVATIFGTLRGFIPELFTIVVANAMGVAGMAAMWIGIRLFYGRPTYWSGALWAVAGVAVFLAMRTYVVDDIQSRIVVISFAHSVICLHCAYELLRAPSRRFPSPATLTALLFALLTVTTGFRAVASIVTPPDPDVFAPNLAQSIHFLITLVCKILILLALMMMALQRLQRELESRNREMEAARARAESASRAKSDFLATMSHELRTPLNAIIGFSDVQRQELFGPLGHDRYREYAADIHASGSHLLDLITSILDISKAEAGKLRVSPVMLDPWKVLDSTLPLIRGAAEAKRIRLTAEAPETELVCHADPQALKQILLNLLSNAVKFTAEDGAVNVRLSAPAADIVEFQVCDTGIGIAPEELPRLMRPFEQGAAGYSRQNGGTGLGLPLVDALVRLHEGSLHIESALGKGTTATVRLPSRFKPAFAAAASPPLPSAASSAL